MERSDRQMVCSVENKVILPCSCGGSWQLVVVGGWQWLVAVGGWQLVVVGGWWLVVVGGRQLAVGGGWWWLAAVDGWRCVAVSGSYPEELSLKKNIWGFLRTALV
jgi:hypothetical protein